VYKNLPQEKLTKVKVFGERNTGTNFLNQLLTRNTDLQVLGHGNNDNARRKLKEIRQSAVRIGSADKFSPQVNRLILNRLIDEERKLEYLDNFGWKHSRVLVDELEKSPHKSSTLFVFLVRNPWRFVSALHRRPYNLFPAPRPDSNISCFIDSQFLANERDNMPSLIVDGPVEFWNKKVKSYFDCCEVFDNAIVCYYENIVTAIDEFMAVISPVCNVSKEIKIPIDSTKNDNKTFDQYRQEVLSYDPVKALGLDVYSKILERIDVDVLHRTIYTPSN
jgi:hypothetical protein